MTPNAYHYLACPNPPHRIAYTEWGDSENPQVLLCIPGFTRTARDFDPLATALSTNCRILCLDLPGRGQSDWLPEATDYDNALYLTDILNLLRHLKLEKIDLLGTSLGGILGLLLATLSCSPIKRLILNDIGASIPQSSLRRIAYYLTQSPPQFANFAEAEDYFRTVHANFGQLTTAQWHHLTRYSIRPTASGKYELCYDPRIALPFRHNIRQIDLWPFWCQITCPVLLLHGEHSDVLTPEIIKEMQLIHPPMKAITFSQVGHAPALMDTAQIAPIQRWLSTNNID